MSQRVVADGKHLALDGRPFRIRGVTYGSFVRRLDGEPFPERSTVKADFHAMADAGLNTVRVYELPPPDVVDAAEVRRAPPLRRLALSGLAHGASTRSRCSSRVITAGRDAVDRAVEQLGDRPHILGLAVGNEVPADVVRVHGIAAVQDALSELVAETARGAPTGCSPRT